MKATHDDMKSLIEMSSLSESASMCFLRSTFAHRADLPLDGAVGFDSLNGAYCISHISLNVSPQKVHDMLKKGWDAEGSPFRGQQFDPSMFDIPASAVQF